MIPAGVNVYPVGVLRQLHIIRAALNPTRRRGLWTGVAPPRWRRDTIRHAFTCIRNDAPSRSAWNGYLAEPTVDVMWHRCGHGWTKRRALRSLKRHIGEVQW